MFAVAVVCSIGEPLGTDGRDLLGDAVIGVPSGRLAVGDPDREDVVEVGAGQWRVRVSGAPRDHPEAVRIWLTVHEA